VSSAPAAILAEDEPLLADELEELLQTLWPQLRIVSRASDGVAALAAIETHAPDLAFLDIHMPLINGIDVARQIAGRCHVAFITSYDEHAIDAFEAGAVDYVLKPPTAARLATTVQRLKGRLQQTPVDLRRPLKDLARGEPAAARYLQWINASQGTAVRLITVEEVLVFQVGPEVHARGHARHRSADQEDDQGTERRARSFAVLARSSLDAGQRARDRQRRPR
jgi:DNA-binding LytR/AlgR family response regulator